MDLDFFINEEDGLYDIEDKKNLLNDMLEVIDSDQLSEIIAKLSTPYLSKKLSDYLQGNKLPAQSSPEFQFLILASKYNGNIVRKLVINEGINDYYLRKFVDKYKLTEISNGVYIFPNKPIDAQFLFQQQYSKSIITYETALYFLDLTDVIPKKTVMSMPRNYNLNQIYDKYVSYHNNIINLEEDISGFEIKYLENDPIVVVRNNSINNSQKVEKFTQYGNPVHVTSPERTIADILKPSHRTEEEVKIEAIRRYLEKFPNNRNKLRRVASVENVLEEIDYYLLGFRGW